jgi:hypothetical protein
MPKQFVVLSDRPCRVDQSFKDETSGLWAVCSLPAKNEADALERTMGCEWFSGGIAKAVEGDFVWSRGRVTGINFA